jgi:adenosylcobinamide-phosphate synthase
VTGVAAAAGVAADQLLGEPPARWHPVALFGTLVQRTEGRLYADQRSRGALLVLVGAGVGATAGLLLRRTLGSVLATIGATAICAAGKMLDEEALRIGVLVDRGDIDGARAEVRSLVGRRADGLDEAGLSRAIVESIAENSVDAVTAPLFWATVAGAPGVLAHRAVNTLDAMVGHRDDRYARFGWASARLDDLVNFVPARLTALAVACVRPGAAGTVWRVVRRDAPAHPSPNGGVVEAAFAAALGVRLGGENRYGEVVEDRGTLGDGRTPGPADIAAAVRLRRHATAAFALGAIGLQLVVHASRRRSR